MNITRHSIRIKNNWINSRFNLLSGAPHAPVVSCWPRIQGLHPKSVLIKTELTDSPWRISRQSYTDELRLCPGWLFQLILSKDPDVISLLKGSAQDIEKSLQDKGASVPEYPRAAVLSLLTVFYKRLRKLRRLQKQASYISRYYTQARKRGLKWQWNIALAQREKKNRV